jgi:exoribonuclease-2
MFPARTPTATSWSSSASRTAAPHAGIGVPQYAWSTSPLRRYVDLVNQWQIIACARHGRTAALVAPFKPKDASLFAIISAFDAAYASYNDFQHGIERFWTLRWLEQHGVDQLDAAVMKDGLVRTDTLPLVFRALGTENLARGTKVRVRITGVGLLTLDVHATLLARIDEQAAVAAAAADGDDEDDSADAGSLHLAIEVGEAADAPPAA